MYPFKWGRKWVCTNDKKWHLHASQRQMCGGGTALPACYSKDVDRNEKALETPSDTVTKPTELIGPFEKSLVLDTRMETRLAIISELLMSLSPAVRQELIAELAQTVRVAIVRFLM